MQQEFDFGEKYSFREHLIDGLRNEARNKILLQSRYGNFPDDMTLQERTEYAREILQTEWDFDASRTKPNQIFAMYHKLQKQKIDEYILERIPEVDERVEVISNVMDNFYKGEQSLTESLDELVRRQNQRLH